MDIQVTGRHMEITEALTNYASAKVEEELQVFPRVESVHVIMDIEKYRQIAEIFVQGANHLRIEGKEESDDMYVSIDKAIEKVAKQLRKARDKVQSHHKVSGIAKTEQELADESLNN